MKFLESGGRIRRFLRHPLTFPFLVMINLYTLVWDYGRISVPLAVPIRIFYAAALVSLVWRFWSAWRQDQDTVRLSWIGFDLWGLGVFIRHFVFGR